MCGIAGIWNYKTGEPVDVANLRRITRLLSHRGPDGEGYHTESALGLGHRRLSIIDLEGGSQPISNEDGSVWIVFNGEIYNYRELRSDLQKKGHTFRTNSDTETIVHLYEEFGVRCFEKLRGMFGLAIWDTRRQQLLLARDRIGIKPLFYGLGKHGIVFGSEIKCIANSALLNCEIDPTAIADLFTFFYIPGPKTIFKDVFSLEPGMFLQVDQRGILKQRYWDLQPAELHLASEQDYREQLLALLRESVQSHLVSDVPVGAFLSGGVDSSSVVALMSQYVDGPIMTCTIGFDEEEYNEIPRARLIAQRFATSHQELTIKPEPAKLLQQLTRFYDQPFPDHSSIPTFYVSQMARKRVKVVLSGDGGDETFGGYSRYRRHVTLERVRGAVPASLLFPFRSRTGNRENSHLPERLNRVLHQTAVGAREGYLHGIAVADAALRTRIFSSDLKRELTGYDPLDQFREIYDRATGSDVLAKISYLDLKTYLVDDVLTKVDRASMANSLEVRVPLLDHKVVEFAFSLPLTMKLREGRGKYLLRETMRSFLPGGFLEANKMGFRVPVTPWMKGPLRLWAEEIIVGASRTSSFLDSQGVRQLWDRFQHGQDHLADILAVLLSFTLSSQTGASAASLQHINSFPRFSQSSALDIPAVS